MHELPPIAGMTEKEAKDFLDGTRAMKSIERKRIAGRKWKIYNQDHVDLIAEAVDKRFVDKETRADLRKLISRQMNPLREITDEISVVYKHGARRKIIGATDDEQRAYERLIRRSHLDVHAAEWNPLASLLGPVQILPTMRKDGTIRYERVLPHHADVLEDPEDPQGDPLALAYTVEPGTATKGAANLVVVDHSAWYYLRTEGARYELVDSEEHGMEGYPGSEFRLTLGERWRTHANEDLVDATMSIAVTLCTMELVRRAQNKYLLTVVGPLAETAKGQGNYPDRAVQFNTADGGQIRLSVEDLNLDPRFFITHIMFLYAQAIEARGIPSHSITFDVEGGGTPSERLRLSHGTLTEIRNRQIPFCRMFESDLARKTIKIARKASPGLAADLPDPERLDEGIAATFPPLARQFNDPRVEMEWTDWMIGKGGLSPLDVLRDDPQESIESLRARQEANFDEFKRWYDAVTSRALPTDGSKMQSAPEAFGRLGPLVRDANRAQGGERSPEE